MDEIVNFYTDHPILLISLAVFLVFLIILLISYGYSKKVNRRTNMALKDSINTVRIFIVDFGKDHATYFNKRDFGERVSGNLDIFFHQFETHAADDIEKWLENLIRDVPGTPMFFEADVNIERKKATYFSLLQVLKVDRDKEVVYLESHLLRYLTPKNQINRKKLQHSKRSIGVNELDPLLKKSKARGRGTLIFIRFFKTNRRKASEPDIEKLLLTQLKDRVTTFLTANRTLVNVSDMEVALFDGRAQDFQKARQIARSLRKSINSYININSIKGYSFTISVVDVRDFQTAENLVDTARNMAIYIEKDPEQITYYDRMQPTVVLDNDFFRKELDLVINEKRLVVGLRPILAAKEGKIVGYFTYVEPSQSLFNNFNEIKDFALKTDREKELFSVMARNVLTKFYNERTDEKHKVFYQVMMSDYYSIMNSLPRMNHAQEVNLVLQFDEEDVAISSTTPDETIEQLSKMKRNFAIALTISDNELTLPNKVYGEFDYFIFDSRTIKQVKNNERELMALMGTLGKLLRYNKPIIISDLQSWSGIEYLVRAGINYISSEELVKKGSMIVPVDKKKVSRLQSFTKTIKR
jgi:hypothetical protein